MYKCFSLPTLLAPAQMDGPEIHLLWLLRNFCGFKQQPSDAVADSIRHLSMGSPSFLTSLPSFLPAAWGHAYQNVLSCNPCLELCGNPAKAGTR